VQEGINVLDEHGYTYEKDGAKWFRATALGDEKDRVLVRANGQFTYFASDVAYHLHKYNTNADVIIDIFGADHHGYMERIRAFLKGLGRDPSKLSILLVQFAILYRGKEKVSMSTRGGQFVTLRELRHEVGNDAARFFYVMRKPEQHLDFDLDLAKSQSNDNPVFYIQYAHARICSVKRQLEETGDQFVEEIALKSLHLLTSDYEKRLLQSLNRFPDIIEVAANNHEPHLLVHYLQDLANAYHTYYNAERFLIENLPLRSARLSLNLAVQIVLQSGLKLLGVSAPQKM
jgi:arginyl-tRNA synthetase